MTEYTLRTLESRDIFPVAQIVNKIGVREFRAIINRPDVLAAVGAATDENGTIDTAKVGVAVLVELAGVLLANLETVKDDLYRLLGSLSSLSRQELETMPAPDFMQMVVDVVKKPEFVDFFRVASKLFK